MKKHAAILLSFAFAFLFVWLFYKQKPGINLFLFELIAMASILLVQKLKPLSPATKWVWFGTFLSGLALVINYSVFSIFITICSFYLLLGTFVYPEARTLFTPALLAVSNTFQSFQLFFDALGKISGSNKGLNVVFRFIKIAFIPLVIIAIFIALYNASNPLFSKGLGSITNFLNANFSKLFSHVNMGLILTFLLGLFFGILTFFHYRNKQIIAYEQSQSDELKRKRNKLVFWKPIALKNELKSALFLLGVLNTLILIVNTIDIYWVWFNFKWEGEYLKQFVHEGTYLLILSIAISIVIVLFYFRGNLNFYSKNKSLKVLAYIWLGQNAVLTLSVAIRNFWYIHYFALAYKRIGVLFFLILVLYGLFSVYQKVRKQKSTFCLIRQNLLATYLMLVFITLFNWDAIIARYNFKHYQTAFVHFDFLADLSYKALPYLDKNLDTLYEIEQRQKELFPFEEQFMSAESYYHKIQQKKERFKKEWPEKNFRSWNFAEMNAYKRLYLSDK